MERAVGGFLHSLRSTGTREAHKAPLPGLAALVGFQQYGFHSFHVARHDCLLVSRGIFSSTQSYGNLRRATQQLQRAAEAPLMSFHAECRHVPRVRSLLETLSPLKISWVLPVFFPRPF